MTMQLSRKDSRVSEAHETRSQRFLPCAALWGMLTLLAAWHLLLAGEMWSVAASGGGAGSGGEAGKLASAAPPAAGLFALVHWRRVDALLGWAALLLLFLSRQLSPHNRPSLGQRRASLLLLSAAAIGFLLSCAAVAWEQLIGSGGQPLAAFADIWLALVALLIAISVLRALSRAINARGGASIVDLWYMVAANWTVAWSGAVIYLRFFTREESVALEGARQLLFGLPALGILPNVLMAWVAGGEWPVVQGPWKARVRAWVLAVGAVNIGAVLMVLRPGATGLFGLIALAGALLMVLGLILFLLGLPSRSRNNPDGGLTRSSPGKILLAAALLLALALLLAGFDRTIAGSSTVVGTIFLGAAWRTFLFTAALLWLASLWRAYHDLTIPPRLQLPGRRGLFLGSVAIAIGGILAAALLLATAFFHGAPQELFLHLLFPLAALQLLGLLALGATLWRTSRLPAA
jgi:hypothetical protein